jgi:hypothetical protein
MDFAYLPYFDAPLRGHVFHQCVKAIFGGELFAAGLPEIKAQRRALCRVIYGP